MKLTDLVQKHLDYCGTKDGQKLLEFIQDVTDCRMAGFSEEVQRLHDMRVIERIEALERQASEAARTRRDEWSARTVFVALSLFAASVVLGTLLVLKGWLH